MAGPHPYTDAEAYRVWRRAIGEVAAPHVDPVVSLPFRISRGDKIVTAGSCFAQHISRRLKQSDYAFLVTESAHPILPPAIAEAFQYGVYPARWGNIYTVRQLLQLLRRAYGRFKPKDDCWEEGGAYFDPFRPQIQPGGFPSRKEYDLDRERHFAAVRRAFEEMDVFIFTLGLTECWVSREDGAAYPVCPGTAAGTYDASRHEMVNLSVDEITADFSAFLDELSAFNPKVRVILSVSPVALAATALDRHVLVSSTYTKSVLRVAADILARRPNVAYFPGYEIVAAPFSRGQYYTEDLRHVTSEGVDHVMRLFFEHATDQGQTASSQAPAPQAPKDETVRRAQALVDMLCDEDKLDPGLAPHRSAPAAAKS